MIRHPTRLLAALFAAAALVPLLPLPAPAMDLVVTRIGAAGPLELAATSWNATPCARAVRATFRFTFADPTGIDYAAVKVNAATAQPAMNAREAAILWIAPGERPERAYRWRYEDEGRLSIRRTIPVALAILTNPVVVSTFTKNGTGALEAREFAIDPGVPGCR